MHFLKYLGDSPLQLVLIFGLSSYAFAAAGGNSEHFGEAHVKKVAKECEDFHQMLSRNGSQFFNASARLFHYNTTETNWTGARDYCQRIGLQLASLKTLTEIEAVTRELINRGIFWHSMWVSASDAGRAPGHFLWADGTPVDNSTWLTGFPMNFLKSAGNDTCVDLHTSVAKLLDYRCTASTFYTLCDVPTTLDACN